MDPGSRITIDAFFARASRHPELAGRRLEVLVGPRGGIVGYRGIGGDLAGRVYSRRVVERIFRAPHRRSNQSFTMVLTPSAYDQAVANYLLNHPGVSVGQARLAVYEAEAYMYKACTKRGLAAQTLEGRTEALRVLGVLEADEVSHGKYPVRFANPEMRIDVAGGI